MICDRCKTGIFAVFLYSVAGCGVQTTIPVTSESPDHATASQTRIFPDDADSAMATLPFVEDELLVQSLPGADPFDVTAAYQSTNVEIVNELTDLSITVVRVTDSELTEAARALADTGLFESIHKNYIYQVQRVPNDPRFSQQDHLSRAGLPTAWDVTTGSDSVVVGVVDSGIDSDHLDLRDKIIDGYNIVDDNANIEDSLGHGTQTAGVAAASSNDGLGIAGVAWDCPVVVARVTDDDGSATSRNIAGGILWAASRNARVINVSFAPLWSNSIVEAAAKRVYGYGSLVVISSGNGGQERNAEGYDEALFVSATDSEGEVTSFSDHGEFVDLAAPGEGMVTTAMSGGYEVVSGTSFAAPMVSGAVALLWSVNPELRPASVRSALLAATIDGGETGEDLLFGRGALAADAAMALIEKLEYIPDSLPPEISIRSMADGDRITSRTSIGLNVEDDWGVADVVLYVDGAPQATDTTQPYRFLLDPRGFAAGTHDVSFVATDFSGNRSDEASVRLVFSSGASTSDLPVVAFDSHDDGNSVSGDVLIEAGVTSGLELLSIEWQVDGTPEFSTSASGSSSDVSFLLRTEEYVGPEVTVTLIVRDIGGRESSESIMLRIE